MSPELFCNFCKFSQPAPNRELFHITCSCSFFTWSYQGDTRIRIETELTDLDICYVKNYSNIAKQDLASSIQDEGYLRAKSVADLKNIGDVNGLSILEIGPGYGHLTEELIKAGAFVYVLDIVPEYLDLVDNNLNVNTIVGDASRLGLSNTFDIVVLTDVLEHVLRPSDVLYWSHKALKANGKIYVRVPSHEANLFYSPIYNCPFELVHLRTYTKDLLLREILAAGFSHSSNPKYLRNSLRYPKNRILGVKSYWLIKRIMLTEENKMRSQPFVTRIFAFFYDGNYGVRFIKIQFFLKFLRIPFTRPGEIFILSSK
jgi:2-polyprenyl-3-methyl-5-hydroxy-6-metoxy-1,4-benzoquinol methylase